MSDTVSQETQCSNPYAGVRFVSPDTMIVMQYLFVIYEHPKDFPDAFVVRRWVIGDGPAKATTDMQTAPTLASARDLVPEGYEHIPRTPGQDPVIVEVWI